MTKKAEREALVDAVGIALVFMFRADPALAGGYLTRVVENGLFTTDQALVLMDELRANNPPASSKEEA